jgi:CheY-like chemotaxis protein
VTFRTYVANDYPAVNLEREQGDREEKAVRILLVEDDQLLGESLDAALRLEQYAVDWLRAGDAVRSKLAATPYDLVILDLGLPGVPGMQVLRQLRADKHGVPVLSLTAPCLRPVHGRTAVASSPA